MNTTNMSNMSYQTMLLHGQRQTHEQTAKENAKQVRNLHSSTPTDKRHTLKSSEKPIKYTLRKNHSFFRPEVSERWRRHIINDTL